MMPTRRELLLSLAIAPLPAGISVFEKNICSGVEIWHEQHCLSQESASGFQLLITGKNRIVRETPEVADKRTVIIAPGVRQMSVECCKELLRRVQQGAWLILETGVCFSSAKEAKRQAGILESIFCFKVLSSVAVWGGRANDDFYVGYTWPTRAFTRSFQAVTPISCRANEAIAFFQNRPVCVKRNVGKGGVVYLGTMLGPALFAEEREAHAIGRAILRSVQLGA